MLNHYRPRHLSRTVSAAWPLLLLLPLVASACISVSNEGQIGATPAPARSQGPPAASATLPALASPTPIPTPEPTLAPVEAEVVGFLPYWFLEDAADPIDTDLLTIAAMHSIEASGNGRLVSKKPSGDVPPGWEAIESDAFSELRDRLQDDGIKVVPVIQRTGWTEGTAARTKSLLGKRKDRRALAGRIAEYVSSRGFDGVNLDFEPVPQDLADEYVELVREVRAALDEVDPGLHLSVDVVASLSGYDLAALTADDAADLAVIMGYNYRTDGAATAGSTAPLRDPSGSDLSTTVEAALEQVAADKLVLALPWYGKSWSTESDEARAKTISGRDIDGPSDPYYARATDLAAQNGRRYQPDQASAWTAYAVPPECTNCPAVWRQVWYDDADSFGAKIDFALQQGLAGVGMWAMGMDAPHPELWLTLRDRLRPRVDVMPPGGTAQLDPETLRGEIDDRDVVEGSAQLRLFASDGPEGSGLVLARIGLDGELDDSGQLATGRTYPAVERITFPLGDASTGGSSDDGPRSIHVQWRDIAGNWSMPLMLDVYAIDADASETPADL